MWMTPQANELSPDTMLTVNTVTLFGGIQETRFPLSAVRPPASSMHPMRTFQANSKHYFIHPECMTNEKLAQALTRRS